jgi:hypothetical protein
MRKFELMKLILLRQYQRRVMIFSKKYVIRPPRQKELDPPVKQTKEERINETLEHF